MVTTATSRKCEKQCWVLLCLPVCLAGLFAVFLNKLYLQPEQALEPHEQDRLRAKGSSLWVSFVLCWLGIVLTWALATARMRSANRRGDTSSFERAQVLFLFASGQWINAAEMSSGYLGLAAPAIEFVVLFTFAFSNLGAKRSVLVSVWSLIIYVTTSLPWVTQNSVWSHPYTAQQRLSLSLPTLVYIVLLVVPCRIAEGLKQRTERLSATIEKFGADIEQRPSLPAQTCSASSTSLGPQLCVATLPPPSPLPQHQPPPQQQRRLLEQQQQQQQQKQQQQQQQQQQQKQQQQQQQDNRHGKHDMIQFRTRIRDTDATFASAHAAVWNYWVGRDSDARALEKQFQWSRRLSLRGYIQGFWLLTLLLLFVYLEVTEAYFLCPKDPRDACPGSCDVSSSWHTTRWGLQFGRTIKAAILLPTIIMYVLVSTNELVTSGHGLTRFTFCTMLLIGSGMCLLVAFTSRMHAYALLLLIFVINNFSVLQCGNLVVINFLLVLCFQLVVRWQRDEIDRWPGENWNMSFTLEKLLPVMMASLACSYTTEMIYRQYFLRHRQLSDLQCRSIDSEVMRDAGTTTAVSVQPNISQVPHQTHTVDEELPTVAQSSPMPTPSHTLALHLSGTRLHHT